MSKAIKFQLLYTEEQIRILQEAAEKNGFKNIARLITARLHKESKKLKNLSDIHPQPKKRIHVRICNDNLLEKLDAYSKLNSIPVAVLIKQLTSDPIILQKYLEAGVPTPHSPEPESLSPSQPL